jgi:O-antigen ligase
LESNLENRSNSFFSILGLTLFVLLLAMPFRLYFNIGPFTTITILDCILWSAVALIFLGIRVFVSNKLLFLSLALPVVLAIISLTWSEDPLATFKMLFYSVTALFGYIVILNLAKFFSTRILGLAVGAFVVLSIGIALLYWRRVPVIWNLFEGISALDVLDEKDLFSLFARLNNPFLGRSNDFASILSLFSIFFVGIALAKREILYLFFAFVTNLGIFLTFSRGVIAAVVIIMTWIMLSKLKLRDVLITMTALSLLIFSAYLFNSEVKLYGQDIIEVRMDNLSDLNGRAEIWSQAIKDLELNSVLGAGGGRYLSKEALVYHNTYLEQWAAYGIFLGSVANLIFLSLPLHFIFWKSADGREKLVSQFVGLSIVVYDVLCLVETSNEAAMPKLYFYMFIGFSVAYLRSLRAESAGSSKSAKAV